MTKPRFAIARRGICYQLKTQLPYESHAILISKKIKPDKYGEIRKSVKLQGASGISVRITGYGKTSRECAEKHALAYILSIAVEPDYSVVKKGFNEVSLEWFENSKSHAALAEKNIQT